MEYLFDPVAVYNCKRRGCMQCRKLFGRVSTKQYMGFPAGSRRLVKYYFRSVCGLCDYLRLNGLHKYAYFSQI